MLGDAEIERWARHVVLPEVGGRGQERLLASRVAVLGGGPAGRHAADLLRRAGVTVTDQNAGTVVDLRLDPAGVPAGRDRAVVWGRLRGARLTVLAFPANTRHPRAAGGDDAAATPVGAPLGACALHVLGALAATEALVVLLAPTHGVRRTTLDLTTGTFTAATLEDPT
jgi:hypothetical protein